MTDFSDFDRYCDEHGIRAGEEPAAFAAWLHEISDGKWDGQASPVEEEGTGMTETTAGGESAFLAALRDDIREQRAHQDEAAADHAEQGHDAESERCYGRVEECDRVLALLGQVTADVATGKAER